MKKTIYSFLLLALAGMFLASCSTQSSTLSIKKRHHRSGYYIDRATTKKASDTQAQVKKSEVVAEVKEAIEQAKTTEATAPVTTTAQATTTTETATPSKANKPAPKTLTASSAKHAPAQLEKIKLKHIASVKELKNLKQRSHTLSAESKGNSNGNHSLIWTIIIVLLVLWLVALLIPNLGLGAIIHLLLVIALVLLLLMLLGVI